MPAIRIPCPECQSVLKLKDRSLLGKMGKCPKCQHKFLLQEPTPQQSSEAQQQQQPVKFELVEEQPDQPEQPAVGANPTWIPDTPATEQPAAPPLDQILNAPAEQTPEASPSQQDQNPLSFLQEESPAASTGLNLNEQPATPTTPIPPTSGSSGVSSRRKRRKKRRQSGGWMMMLIVLIVVGGGAAFL